MTKAKLPAVRRPKTNITRRLLVDEGDFGPAMLALPPRQQKFAIAYWQCRDQTEAARQAGYAAHNQDSIKTQGCRLAHSPKVIAAIRELGKSVLETEGVKIAIDALLKAAADPQHKDQIAAAKTILDRAGINTATTHNHNVTVEITDAQKIERLRALADVLGMTQEQVLGFVDLDPEEYQEVKDD